MSITHVSPLSYIIFDLPLFHFDHPVRSIKVVGIMGHGNHGFPLSFKGRQQIPVKMSPKMGVLIEGVREHNMIRIRRWYVVK